jgi:dienelactone hydrolase
MPAWLLVPKELNGRVPAVICMYGPTSGAGKDVTVGLSGRKPKSEPVRNLAIAIDIVEAGFVALAPDYLRDGERTPKSGRPYDTTEFYERHPDWSIVGKDVWDNGRAVDYLQTLEFVDPERIGMTGHSYGGHSTIFLRRRWSHGSRLLPPMGRCRIFCITERIGPCRRGRGRASRCRICGRTFWITQGRCR